MVKLEPCPFCGTVDDGGRYSFMFTGERVVCSKCGAEGPSRDNQKAAIDAWNKRKVKNDK